MQRSLEKMSLSDAQPIKFDLLKTITEDFSEKLKIGSGGYGEVYKAVLYGDEIAVKKLFPVNGVNDETFENEFRNLKKVQQHKNVIRMIGYCYEIAHRDIEYKGEFVWSRIIDRALCYEYMKGGSLTKHISAESCIHDWTTTYKIISGTCEGLHHLHKGGGENKIFHLDLKPDNVLLDEALLPKIGDFGLSMLFGTSYTHQIIIQKGTRKYMPPEYIQNGMVSPKNDVFSLGVIIFHMMVGEKGYDDYWDVRRRPNFSPKNQQDFIERVQEYWKTKMQGFKDYRWHETDRLGVTKCIEMTMSCVEDDRDKRPAITEIMGKLKELDSKIEEMLKEDPKPLIVSRKIGESSSGKGKVGGPENAENISSSMRRQGMAAAVNSPQDFVDLHNAARADVGIGPVSWDHTVAEHAQSYAEQRRGDPKFVSSRGPYGRNIFWGSAGKDWSAADAVKKWVSNKQYYDHGRNTSSEPGGGCYTQVVWRDSTAIGAARVVCDDGEVFIVCFYNPPGNVRGKRPY